MPATKLAKTLYNNYTMAIQANIMRIVTGPKEMYRILKCYGKHVPDEKSREHTSIRILTFCYFTREPSL